MTWTPEQILSAAEKLDQKMFILEIDLGKFPDVDKRIAREAIALAETITRNGGPDYSNEVAELRRTFELEQEQA